MNVNILSHVQSVKLFLTQPAVKEGIKNICSVATFIFGLYEIQELISGKEIHAEPIVTWIDTANKIVKIFAQLSLILSAVVSRPGMFLISPLLPERLFGPNTIFAVNPWHPKHILSFVAAILSAPHAIATLYKRVTTFPEYNQNYLFANLVLFNSFTSRPLLHFLAAK